MAKEQEQEAQPETKGSVVFSQAFPASVEEIIGRTGMRGEAIQVRCKVLEGRDKNNPIGEEIKTPNYVERTLKLLEVAQAYVVFKGGTGTISEFGMAWGLARLYFGHHKPLILYGKFWENIMAAFLANMRMRPEEFQVYRVVTSPDEVVKCLDMFDFMLLHEKHLFSPAERAFEL